jgi:hypothetical protein
MRDLQRALARAGIGYRVVLAHNAPLRGIARDHYPEVRTRADAVAVLKMLGLSRNKAQIDDDGTVTRYRGDVDLAQLGLTKIPLNFIEVTGTFSCSWNRLRSLEGCPKRAGSVIANENELESLRGGPEVVLREYDVSSNNLKSLDVLPTRVGEKLVVSRNPGCPFQRPHGLKESTLFYGGSKQ